MNDKVLSIVIPSYNMEEYLNKCIQSLLIDSIEALEILIINDGSKDNTSNIGHKYAELYPNSIKIIDKENGNYGSCINVGLSIASGKYIKILDADDSFKLENLEVYVNILKEVECDLIITDYIIVDEKDNETYHWNINLSPNIQISKDKIESLLCNHMFQMHAVTYKTDILRRFHYTQLERIPYTDQQWMFLPISEVKSVYYINKVIYRYLIGREGQTVSSDAYARNYKAIYQISNQILNDYLSLSMIKQNSYMTFRLQKQLELLYYVCLTKNVESQYQLELIEFDRRLKDILPSVYRLLENIRLQNTNFYYIKYWRNSKYTDKFRILFLLKLIREVRRKLKIHFHHL